MYELDRELTVKGVELTREPPLKLPPLPPLEEAPWSLLARPRDDLERSVIRASLEALKLESQRLALEFKHTKDPATAAQFTATCAAYHTLNDFLIGRGPAIVPPP